eukprot:CAMPEP_0202061692 /NCGR_PEP_ID=MMETSP0963-20130614/41871_1 /ASSEMBLY_ACC=CAM_ASM_000494 /TAXON_ID=4773 /ORGANISM="Schizochytrium aggregatum, Strain ATCC28209" /LENGTH=222 /DNA_ID=CAMNT_0048627931 /DNA_START=34 /DNA_END=700 /DNA_ORIENTATION=+
MPRSQRVKVNAVEMANGPRACLARTRPPVVKGEFSHPHRAPPCKSRALARGLEQSRWKHRKMEQVQKGVSAVQKRCSSKRPVKAHRPSLYVSVKELKAAAAHVWLRWDTTHQKHGVSPFQQALDHGSLRVLARLSEPWHRPPLGDCKPAKGVGVWASSGSGALFRTGGVHEQDDAVAERLDATVLGEPRPQSTDCLHRGSLERVRPFRRKQDLSNPVLREHV